MTSDIPPGDVLAAALGDSLEPLALAETTAVLVPLADRIRNTLAGIALIPIDRATAAERTHLVNLRTEIQRIHRDTTTWLDAIDLSFRRAAMNLGAKQIPLTDGFVVVEPPRAEWKVDVAGLEAELKELVKAGGNLSVEELGSIFEVVVTTKANGSRLNYFARNRGDEVAEVIERHRELVPGNPLAAKVQINRKAE